MLHEIIFYPGQDASSQIQSIPEPWASCLIPPVYSSAAVTYWPRSYLSIHPSIIKFYGNRTQSTQKTKNQKTPVLVTEAIRESICQETGSKSLREMHIIYHTWSISTTGTLITRETSTINLRNLTNTTSTST